MATTGAGDSRAGEARMRARTVGALLLLPVFLAAAATLAAKSPESAVGAQSSAAVAEVSELPLAVTCPAEAAARVTRDVGRIRVECTREGRVRHGPQLELAETAAGSRLIEETQYVDGRRSGRFRSFFPTGQLHTEGWYLRGKREGRWRSWREGGGLEREEHYRAGLLHGKSVLYWSTGQPWFEQSYDSGKAHGEGVTYERPNGESSAELLSTPLAEHGAGYHLLERDRTKLAPLPVFERTRFEGGQRVARRTSR